MKISSATVENYKSFRSSGEIQFTSGFNVIVGQNNAGKTALVEALSLKFSNRIHRSLKTLPTRSYPLEGNSKVSMTFELNKSEFLELLRDFNPTFYVPVVSDQESLQSKLQNFLSKIGDKVLIRSVFQDGQSLEAYQEGYVRTAPPSSFQSMILRIDPESLQISLNNEGLVNVARQDNYAVKLANALSQRIYMFSAERLNISDSEMGRVRELESKATNLPQVLNFLQTSNSARFANFNQVLRKILPDIQHITVPVISASRAEINVWSIDPTSERDDLAMKLSESGTGIGQVLAILYVAFNSDYPRTIIIDEPQSFLHPGAVRKLFDILKELPVKHQYIISTHSPAAVTAAEARTLLLIRKANAESTVQQIAPEKTQELQLVLSEVGARLSDVFGSDNILWVEGRTEELCFPLIVSKVANKPLFGTTILGVVQTGDFEGRHSQTIIDIYNRLSTGEGLLPPAIGFIFDQEGRTEQEQADLRRRGKGIVHFLGRRMYENYLINPAAISAVTSKIEGFRDKAIDPAEILEWLRLHKWERKFIDMTIDEKEQTEELWIRKVNGARILKDLFTELSETRVNYDKIAHGVALTNWILENAPDDLREVGELLEGILETAAPANHTIGR